jgi:serine/threonine protein kinase
VHDSDGVKALVLELVAGETLADRIIRQPPSHRGLPIDEATAIATQIIDALETRTSAASCTAISSRATSRSRPMAA